MSKVKFRNIPCGEVVWVVKRDEEGGHGPGIYVTVKLLDSTIQPELGSVMIGKNYQYVPEEPDETP